MSNLQIEEKLFNIQNSISKLSLAVKTILTADEASEFLGLKPSYLYKLTSDKKIKFFKPQGKLIYFKREDLEEFLLRNPSDTVSQVEREVTSKWSNK